MRSRHVHEQLTHAVHQAVDQYQGHECLLLVVEALQEAAATAVEQANQHAVEKSRSSEEKLMRTAAPTQIGRRAIWFHHIKSLTKRKHIVEWSKELNLGGFSKPGYPGVIICEGCEADAEEFVHRLRQLRWKAMAVRGEEQEDLKGEKSIDSARKFSGNQIIELDENSMSELASACKSAGLEQLFLSAMKISK